MNVYLTMLCTHSNQWSSTNQKLAGRASPKMPPGLTARFQKFLSFLKYNNPPLGMSTVTATTTTTTQQGFPSPIDQRATATNAHANSRLFKDNRSYVHFVAGG